MSEISLVLGGMFLLWLIQKICEERKDAKWINRELALQKLCRTCANSQCVNCNNLKKSRRLISMKELNLCSEFIPGIVSEKFEQRSIVGNKPADELDKKESTNEFCSERENMWFEKRTYGKD